MACVQYCHSIELIFGAHCTGTVLKPQRGAEKHSRPLDGGGSACTGRGVDGVAAGAARNPMHRARRRLPTAAVLLAVVLAALSSPPSQSPLGGLRTACAFTVPGPPPTSRTTGAQGHQRHQQPNHVQRQPLQARGVGASAPPETIIRSKPPRELSACSARLTISRHERPP